jgi:hypothetical protein
MRGIQESFFGFARLSVRYRETLLLSQEMPLSAINDR